MQWFAVFGCFFVAAIGYLKDRKLYGVSGFMGIFFGTILLFSIIKPYPLYDSEDRVYLYIFLGVFFYYVGTVLRSNRKIVIISNVKRRNHYSVNKKFYRVGFIIVIVTFLPVMLGSIIYLLQGHSMGEVYYAFAAMRYQGDTTLASLYIFQVLYEFIGKPFAYYMIPLSMTLFGFTGEKKYVVHSILLTIGFLIIGFQRSFIVYEIIYVLLMFALLSYKQPERLPGFFVKIKRVRKQIVVIGIIVLLAFVMVSVSRANVYSGRFDFGRTLYYYYCICTKLFDNALKVFETGHYNHTFGLLSFRGFFSPFVSIIEKFGTSVPLFNTVDSIMTKMSTPIWVSPTEYANSFVTLFFTFYADAGIVGICAFSSLIGFIAKGFYNSVINDYSPYTVSRFMFFFATVLFFAQVNCAFIQIGITWGFIISRFFFDVET